MSDHVLSLATFLPLLGAVLVLLQRSDRLARWLSLAVTLATLAVLAPLVTRFDKGASGLQFEERHEWIPDWGIDYGMGVDGLSVPLILLAALLSVLCVSVSWTSV